MIIAIDFDGTCVSHQFPNVGKDIGAVPVLKRLIDHGHRLILWTMRADCRNNTGFSDCVPEIHNGPFLTEALVWFEEKNIPLWAVQRNPEQDSWTTSPKCYAQLYIDDSALGIPLIHPEGGTERPYVDWKVTEYLLERMGLFVSRDQQLAF